MRKAAIFYFLISFLIMLVSSCEIVNKGSENKQVGFTSDNKELNEGFEWAKKQALQYAFEGDAVGKWYEASLPGREAFCMRDVSHQCMGAQILGLAENNKNMLEKFAEGIAQPRDWCSYWEINKEGLPAPVDYTNDSNFWYNLPANFDVMDACYRMYQWTGDTAYLNNPVFLNFYKKSVFEYVAAWDQDNDGIMESPKANWPRGIPTYWESDDADFVTGSDLVASMYSGYYAFSKILAYSGDSSLAAEMMNKAEEIQQTFNEQWWDSTSNTYYKGRKIDGSYIQANNELLKFYPLRHEIITDKVRVALVLKNIGKDANVEESSYLPELFYHYNQNDRAFKYLLQMLDPNLERRDYPEVSFSAIGAIAGGLMGIKPRASQNLVETFPRLTSQLGWAEMNSIPVFGNKISVRHNGIKETVFTNNSGNEILWQASFPVISNVLSLNGENKPCERTYRNNQNISFIIVRVKPGETYTAAVPF